MGRTPTEGRSPVPAAQSGRTGLCSGGTGTWQNRNMATWEPEIGKHHQWGVRVLTERLATCISGGRLE